MRYIYISFICILLLYFLFKKRRIDFFLIYFMSSVFYYLPLIFNNLFNIVYNGMYIYERQTINEWTYIFACLNLGIIFVWMIYWDNKKYSNYFPLCRKDYLDSGLATKAMTALTILNIGLILLSLKNNLGVLISSGFNKVLFIQNYGVKESVIRYLSIVIIIFSFTSMNSNKKLKSCSILFMLYSLFLGRRSDTVISFISIFIYHFSKQNNKVWLINFIKKNKVQFLIIFLIMVLIMPLKKTLPIFQRGDIKNGVVQTLEKIFDPETYNVSESNSITLYIDKINETKFRAPMYSYSTAIFELIPLAETITQGKLGNNRMDKLFQTTFFPTINKNVAGLGGTFWGEVIINGGFLFLIIMLNLLGFVIGKLNEVFNKSKKEGNKVFIIVLLSFFSFFIHRLYLADVCDIFKMLLIIWILYVFFIWFFGKYKFELRKG